MRIKPLPPRRQTIFYTGVGLAVGLVLISGFFSFKKTWSEISFSPNSLSRLEELKSEVQEVGSDFKDDMRGAAGEVVPVVEETTAAIIEGAEQRQEAQELLGELMKENLSNQYGETQENNKSLDAVEE